MVSENTPVEPHVLAGETVLVKREDLCCALPGPGFSKMRGVWAHLARRPETVIGVLDTYHSQAGWAVSYVCSALGKRAVNYWPRYAGDGAESWRWSQKMALSLGAELVALPAGRSAILYHAAKKDLAARYPGAYMIANALKLPESVEENAAEAQRTVPLLPAGGTLVVSISSGTVAAGVVRGFDMGGVLQNYDVVLHMGYSRSAEACSDYIQRMAGTLFWQGRLVDEGYGYADHAEGIEAPFPCNRWYDLKAWKWLAAPGVLASLRPPVVFWNIGA